MIETIYKGFIIGIIVSAPMGPIGILCVQRTLNRGRLHGLVTGLGAMVSDLIYATITLIGMGIVDDLMKANELLLQFVGSIIIVSIIRGTVLSFFSVFIFITVRFGNYGFVFL